MFKCGVQTKHLCDQCLDVAQVRNMAGFGPPVLLFHKAAAVGSFCAFVGNGVDFPAHVQWAGRQVRPDFYKDKAEEASYRQIAQKVKKSGHMRFLP